MSRFPIFAAAILVVGATALSWPQDVPEPRLGANWRCTRVALLITTCTQLQSQARTAPSQLGPRTLLQADSQ